MIRIDINRLRDGYKLSSPVLDSKGRLLIGEGIPLDSRMIKHLKELGLQFIPIIVPGYEDITPLEAISKKVEMFMKKEANEIIKTARRTAMINPERIINAIDYVMNDMLAKSKTGIVVDDLRTNKEFLFDHLTRVCIYSGILGTALGLNDLRLRTLMIIAYLHDVGMALIDDESILNGSYITDNPDYRIKEHPKLGRDLCNRAGFPFIVNQSIYQHHERIDGKGYPLGLLEKDITIYAKIVSLVDAYDILTSPLPHRKPYLPNEAIEFIMALSNSAFDKDVLKAFLKKVVPYPPGTLVLLSDNQICVVKDCNNDLPLRPILKTYAYLENNQVKYVDKPTIIDLKSHLDLTIVGQVDSSGKIVDYEGSNISNILKDFEKENNKTEKFTKSYVKKKVIKFKRSAKLVDKNR
ncbi:HD-GYP domain, c-di-GMP phosphodiesterase class II (or its inactivated variant) [Thermodesulfobium acidiphilum]|uniref:HD-GYP domain, c-di-GMP phosphodiesterase class II (Or its inactivated variant) n=1 Tax=Thermodesulfobium acidiphilum TaxID=1794699 RepID=A0A2R4VYR7_THEAF|nr:HD domain-containing phosphohydrolase [Thermodesulfobium acidiphilum]AWB09618.1 HD-GYP domain, c-di-GMP phosphodiesterase class II (or its inactivated variant) [Thermodesulfobium acidiphilum]